MSQWLTANLGLHWLTKRIQSIIFRALLNVKGECLYYTLLRMTTFSIWLLIVVNSTRVAVHLSTELVFNAWRLSDVTVTLMPVDRWERSLCYNLLYLMSDTWLHEDSHSHTIALFIGLETQTNWMNGSTLRCVLFSAKVNNISKIQSRRFPKPQFTSAKFILCQSIVS